MVSPWRHPNGVRNDLPASRSVGMRAIVLTRGFGNEWGGRACVAAGSGGALWGLRPPAFCPGGGGGAVGGGGCGRWAWLTGGCVRSGGGWALLGAVVGSDDQD